MIVLSKVIGNVMVEDLQNKRSIAGYSGMVLHETGNYRIITNSVSRVTIKVNQKIIPISENSILSFGPSVEMPSRAKGTHPVKLFYGRIWGWLTKDRLQFTGPNAAIGVRG
ncbi:MAG: hypothetical protein R6W71_02020 [Bacteroidales bacterium]|jgi:hypothetical protein